MPRIATITAFAAVLGAAVLALMGTFAGDVQTESAAREAALGGGGWSGLDRRSAGILGGALMGAAVALLSHTLVSMSLKVSTEAAFKALTIGFFAKALGAILPWAALSFLPQVGRVADATAYLIAFATVVLIVLCGGLFDHLRAMAEGRYEASDRKSLTEFVSGSSDQRSGSAFSPPRNPTDGQVDASFAGSVSTVGASVSPSVHPLGSGESLESAT